MKIKGIIEDLKIKKNFKLKNDSKNTKNISGTFSGGVVGSVGSVHFWIVLGLDYIFQDLYFQGGSLCFSFFCLLVSSVSVFCPDTRGRWWTLFLFFRLTYSVALWGGRDAANK